MEYNSELIDKAFDIANRVHAEQKDLAGKPYLNHIQRVINNTFVLCKMRSEVNYVLTNSSFYG